MNKGSHLLSKQMYHSELCHLESHQILDLETTLNSMLPRKISDPFPHPDTPVLSQLPSLRRATVSSIPAPIEDSGSQKCVLCHSGFSWCLFGRCDISDVP